MKKRMTAASAALGVLCAVSLAAVPAAAAESTAEAAAESAAVSAAEAVETAGDPVLLGSKESRVFNGTLDSDYTLTTWDVEGEEDVPYVPVDEYMNVLFAESYLSSLEYAWDGNVYTITQNGVSIAADLDAQKIWCGDWRGFRGPNAAGAIPAGIVEKTEFLAIRPSVKNESSQTEPDGYEVSLADYGIRMIRHGDQVLMPFAAAQSVFGATFQQGVLAYNGDDYFDIVNWTDSIYGSESQASSPNPYADQWYSGRFASQSGMTEAYARYNYESMCLLLDLTYGHKEEKGISSFDSYFEEQGLKEAFLTPDPKDDGEALQKMFGVLFDSGHDAELLSPSIFDSEGIPGKYALIHAVLDLIGYESMADVEKDLEPVMTVIFKLINLVDDTAFQAGENAGQTDGGEPTEGPNTSKLIADSIRMMVLKPLFYGDNNVTIEGDTCVVYFEHFAEDLQRNESFYTKLPGKADLDKSSFALFYYAFDQIKKDGNVKKVVFDVSNNGGGSAAALVSLLGFLSEDGEVHITYRDLLNRNYVSEYYHIDTNLDGKFDDGDGYGGEYDFYILTSGSSYSCGTAFPYFAQKNKLAKVVGQKPGGGDCVVGNFVDAAGHVGAISGFLQLGTMDGDEFVSDETAVEPDLPMTDEEVKEVFFHPKKIAKYISEHTES